MKADWEDEDTILSVEGLGKIFCGDLRTSLWYGLRDSLGEIVPPLRRRTDAEGELVLRSGEFWANRAISFSLKRGESLGLVGHNGAGKTTLLKMLNGIIKPNTGSIAIRGRVGALIALQAGFNPLLTGRENIYIYGAVIGLNRYEVTEKFDQIVEFSGLESAIDSPVQNYSSGMSVRLGFAVAAHLEPDLLLLDEILAVGDAEFRERCFNHIDSLRRGGTAFILVSHNDANIARFCDRAIYLSSGEVAAEGPCKEVLRAYRRDGSATFRRKRRPVEEPEGTPALDGAIAGVDLCSLAGVNLGKFKPGDGLRITVHGAFPDNAVADPVVVVQLRDEEGTIFGTDTEAYDFDTNPFVGGAPLELSIEEVSIAKGDIEIEISLFSAKRGRLLDMRRIGPVQFRNLEPTVGRNHFRHQWRLLT